MPQISISREYSTSKNIKLYLLTLSTGEEQVSDKALVNFDMADIATYPIAENDDTQLKFFLNKIPNLQEIPDLSTSADADRDTIEITTLEDEYHEFADGLKNRNEDNQALDFTFLYDGPCYDALRVELERLNAYADGKDMRSISEDVGSAGYNPETDAYYLYNAPYFTIMFVVLPDGSAFAFRVKHFSTTLSGAGVSAALTFTLNCSVDEDMAYHYPALTERNLFELAGIYDGNVANIKKIGKSSGGDWANIN